MTGDDTNGRTPGNKSSPVSAFVADEDATQILTPAMTAALRGAMAPPSERADPKPEPKPKSEPKSKSEPKPDGARAGPAHAAIAPLREAVLSGRFVSERHQDAAARLAALLAPRELAAAEFLESWFGTGAVIDLLRDRDRLRGAIDRDIAAIDARLGAMIDAILHAPRLRRLEASWRALSWLGDHIGPASRLKLKVLNVAWPELCRDLERAAEFDQSQAFRHIYEDEFGMPGGEPYGLLLLDYEIRHRPDAGAPTDDVSAVASLSGIAAAAFAPMVINAAPALFGVDAFAELSGVADPAGPFAAVDYGRWRGLALREDVRFMAVSLPRLLVRPLWDEIVPPRRGFHYRERINAAAERNWAGACYAVAACVMRAFDNHGWPADMRGYESDREGGGIVGDLPQEPFSTDIADGMPRPSIEVILTDRQERNLIDAGFMPLMGLPYGGEIVLGAARSLQTAQRYSGSGSGSANSNAKLSAQFNTMVCVSRFAHYVKVMGRDMVGAFLPAETIQQRLSHWLLHYTNANLGAGADSMARYPLVSSSVRVSEMAGKPGAFRCEINLQPQFQLDDISASFRLLTELAAPGAS